MKSFIKQLLRQLGLLKFVRKWQYQHKYKALISRFEGQDKYDFHMHAINAHFSLSDPYSASFFATYFNHGVYEEEGLRTLIEETTANSIVFDIGANIGYFTCVAAVHCKEGAVHAFEMGKENFLILERNVALNRLTNTALVCKAVSDEAGEVSIMDSPVGNAVTKILEGTKPGGDVISVSSISLDDYTRQSNVRPDFVKIDVEGAEMKVLQGMKETLKGSVKLLIEIHDKELRLFRSSKQDVLDFIDAQGFSTRIITNDVRKNLLLFAWK